MEKKIIMNKGKAEPILKTVGATFFSRMNLDKRFYIS